MTYDERGVTEGAEKNFMDCFVRDLKNRGEEASG